MTTATPRRYLDADSHVLEPTDWLTPYADSDIRDRMRTLANPLAPDNASAAVFSTYFPHPESTRDPIGRFEAHLERFDEDTRQRFYIDNMAELVGSALPTTTGATR
jgi:hypothetical protein